MRGAACARERSVRCTMPWINKTHLRARAPPCAPQIIVITLIISISNAASNVMMITCYIFMQICESYLWHLMARLAWDDSPCAPYVWYLCLAVYMRLHSSDTSSLLAGFIRPTRRLYRSAFINTKCTFKCSALTRTINISEQINIKKKILFSL